MLIESLTASLDDGVSGLQLLIGQIYEALEELQSVQDSLVGQMKLKQQILDGTCDEGFEFKGFQDGAHVCQEEAKSNGPIEVVHVVVSRELAFKLYPYQLVAKIETETVNAWSTSRAGRFNAYCPNGSSLVGGGITAYPEYFLKISDNMASFYYQNRDRWYADFDLKLVPGEDYRANPLWTPYLSPCSRTEFSYSQCSSDPEDTWAVSVFAACAVVSSDYTFE